METKSINGEISGRESETPLLMISHGKPLEKHVIYNPSEKRFRVINNIPELHDKKVLGSIYGWLVLVEHVGDDDDGDCCLFNPITKDKIELPKLNNSRDYNECILTKPPTEPNCYILFTNSFEQSFCRIGDKEYVKPTLQQEDEEQENGFMDFDMLQAIVSFRGKTYGFTYPDKFVTIHLVGNSIEFKEIPIVERSFSSYSSRKSSTWLIEASQSCGGDLLMVQRINSFTQDWYEGLDFMVFRIDINQNRVHCVEIENIGNQTIFLSYNGAGYCCPAIGTKPNSIYYTNEDETNLDRNLKKKMDRNLHIFDLEDRSTKSMLPYRGVAANKPMTTSWVPHDIFGST